MILFQLHRLGLAHHERPVDRRRNGGLTNMAEWIEVPAHRIYVISGHELRDGFDYIGENGKPVERSEIAYRFVRKTDGKVFKLARFIPQYTRVHVCTALEEI
jgi:hypothetical protein